MRSRSRMSRRLSIFVSCRKQAEGPKSADSRFLERVMDMGVGRPYRSSDHLLRPVSVDEMGEVEDGVEGVSLEGVAAALADDEFETAGRTFGRNESDRYHAPATTWDLLALIRWRIEHGLMLSLNSVGIFNGQWPDLLRAMERA